MKNDFLENLLSFYEEDPGDPFNIYALAIEYLKSDTARSVVFFDKLLLEHPDYLPAYYQAAELFTALEDNEKAEKIYQKGIEIALRQNNSKTHQELNRAYRSFLDELEY